MSNARNLARLLPNASGQVPTSNLVDASVTAQKIAAGAAASNLGSYVSSVNGSSGAVTVSASGLGIGQTWQSTGKSNNVTYTNTSGKPIYVSIVCAWPQYNNASAYVDGNLVWWWGITNNYAVQVTITFIVPNGSSYYTQNIGVQAWMELR